MKLVLKILIIGAILYCGSASACNCKNFGTLDSIRSISYRNADLVFLGELISSDTVNYSSYKFKIIETFKGNYNSSELEGLDFSSCSLFPSIKGQWIVYAHFIENSDQVEISLCLGSRSKTKPQRLLCYPPPPPPRPNQTPNEQFEEETALYNDKLLNQARKDWEEELELLREKRK